MSSTGLSRRRVHNSATSSSNSLPSTPTPPTTTSPPSDQQSASKVTVSHAGSAFEGGSKVAFDPRDLERDGEDIKVGGKMPRLTLMEEVLLLGIKDKQVSAHCRFCLVQHLLSEFCAFFTKAGKNQLFSVSTFDVFHLYSDGWSYVLPRDTSPFGTTTYHMPFVDAF